MKRYLFGSLILSLGILMPLAALAAEEQADKKVKAAPEAEQVAATEERTKNARPAAAPLIPYIPPAPEQLTPQVRTATAGTRGEPAAFPTVTLLVPEHVAYTVQAQPTLYWHLDKATKRTVVLTLTLKAVKPLLERSLPRPVSSGLHALRLSAHGVQLETGKTYEWSVSIRQDPESPASDDLVARGFVERVAPSAELQEITAADPLSQARAYAKAGIWYDALAALSETTADRAMQPALRQGQAQLLEQVGLAFILSSR